MPVRLFKFTSGSTETFYTDARLASIDYDSNTYVRASVSLQRGDVDLAGGKFTVAADPALSPVERHVTGFPPDSLRCEVRLSNGTLVHSGELTSWAYKRRGDFVELEFDSLRNAMSADVPEIGHGPTCNWILSGARDFDTGAVLSAGVRAGRCTVDLDAGSSPCEDSGGTAIPFSVAKIEADFAVSADGLTWTTNDGATGKPEFEPWTPDGTPAVVDFGSKWFVGGTLRIIRAGVTLEKALIVGHSWANADADSALTLLAPITTEIDPTDEIRIVAGCGHTAFSCRYKFGNEAQNGGFPFAPNKDPFREGFV